MDPATGQLLVMFVRMALTSAFTFAQINGAKPEEIDRIFKEEFQKVKDRKPEDLPDV